MSYFCPDDDDIDCEVGASVFDALLAEIDKTEQELAGILRQVANQPVGGKAGEAAVLEEEVKVMEESKAEGIVEDPEIRYYLAVGKVEKQLEEMRQMKEMSDQCITSDAATLKDLDDQIKEQKEIISRLEKEVTEADTRGETVEDVNLLARKEMNKQIRANKILLRSLKSDLKKFIDCTDRLNPDHNAHDGSPFGYLLQALWQNYLTNGMEYIGIQDQDFDVPKPVLDQLIQAGIVRVHPTDPDKIRMEDFTCST
jgi:signal recognition particle GTPase